MSIRELDLAGQAEAWRARQELALLIAGLRKDAGCDYSNDPIARLIADEMMDLSPRWQPQFRKVGRRRFSEDPWKPVSYGLMSLERAETDVTAEEMEVIARGFGISGTRLGRLKGLARTASAHPFPEGLDRRIGDAYEQLLTESNRSVASWRGLFTEAPSLLLAPQLLNNLVLRHREQGAMTDEARAVADDYAFIQSERRRNLEALAASGKPVMLIFSSSSLDRQLIGSPSDVRYAFDNLQRLHDAGARVRVATACELGAREAFEVAFRGSRTLPGWYADGYPGHSNGHAIRRSRLRSVEETSLSHDESAHLIAALDKAVTRRAIKARSTMTRDAEVIGPERDHATAMQLERMLLSVARDRFAVVDPTSVDAGWNPDHAVTEKALIRRIQHLRFDGPNAAWFTNQMRNDPGFAAHTLRIANLVPAYADALETNHVAGPLLFDSRDEIAAELDRRRKEITFDGWSPSCEGVTKENSLLTISGCPNGTTELA